MKGSLIVVGFFILGVLAGRSGGLPSWAMDSNISFVALCGLLLFVGLGIGMNPDMKNDIKSLNPRLALLPVATILGSWLGAMVAYIIKTATISLHLSKLRIKLSIFDPIRPVPLPLSPNW